MLEIILCSLVTILPDYLYRRYVQGKRLGREITLFSVWFELRFGIITCFMLAVALITMIFYFHPSTTSATLYYRTVPIVPETTGRVAEKETGAFKGFALHVVDAVAIVHAMLLRIQALLLPIKTLVLSGH